MKKKIVSVIGLGYIGLPTAAIIAQSGHIVNGVDNSREIVSNINQGKIHIKEKNLNKIVKKVIRSGKLKAFTEVQPSDVYIICVPTPLKKKD